jgi:serine/threonine protein kinase
MRMLSHLGTLEFSAPETIEGYGGYSEQIDLWSAGIILYFLYSGVSPFKGEK